LIERNQGQPLSFGIKALSGMLSGSIAVCIGTPMDVTLVRMQADSMKPKELRRDYKNVIDALGRIAKEEGILKLYSGLLPNILRGMSMNVGMLSCYDQVSMNHDNSLSQLTSANFLHGLN
jgi:solute carrier family 25 oxoglutarate transporter 11